jgi:hypothetical protein
VTGVAVSHLDLEVSLLVAIQADSHGAVSFTRDGVKTVAHTAVAVTAMNTTWLAKLDMVDEGTMGHFEPVAGDLVGQILMADQALLRLLGAHVSHKALVSRSLVLRFSVTTMTSDTSQLSVRGDHRLGFYQVGISRFRILGARL